MGSNRFANAGWRSWYIAGLAAACVLIVSNATAAWPTSAGSSLATFTTTDTLEYSLSFSDGVGGIFVVWLPSSAPAPLARHIGSDSNVIGPTDGTPIWTADVDHYQPVAAPDGQGGLLIVRSAQPGADDATKGVWVQRIDANCARLWGDNGVQVTQGLAEGFSVANDDNGGAYVAWHEDKGFGNAIYGQRISAAGAVQWAPNGNAVADEAFWQVWPIVVADGGGGAIIAWQDFRNGNHYKLYAQSLTPAGLPNWVLNGIKFCNEEEDQLLVAGIPDGLGGAVYTWLEDVSSNSDVHVQRLSKAGDLKWSDDGINVTPFDHDQLWPQLAPDGIGGAFVVWRDFYSDPEGDIFAQRIDSEGKMKWDPDSENVRATSSMQNTPTVSIDGDGGLFIAWEDSEGYLGANPATDLYDIHAQRLDRDGDKLFLTSFLPVTFQPGHQYWPSLFPDARGGAIATWYSSNDLDHSLDTIIYAAKIRFDGTLGESPTTVPRNLVGTWTNPAVELKPNGQLKVKGKLNVTNLGSVITPSFTVRVVLSVDNKYDSGDTVIETKTVKKINPQATKKVSASESLAPPLPVPHYLIGVIDLAGTVAESNETDNQVVIPF